MYIARQNSDNVVAFAQKSAKFRRRFIGNCMRNIEFFGNIVTAPVKYCIERNKAICMPDDEAEKLIYEKAKESISLIGTKRVRPYKVSMPMEVVQEYTRADYADAVYNLRTDLDRLDARTLRKVVNKIEVYKDVKF